jgi:hypothetical protein
MVTDPFDDLAAQMAAQPEPDPLKVGLIRQRLLAAMEEEAGLAPRRARRVFRRGELLSVPESRRFALSVAVIAVLAVAVFLVPFPELFHFGPGTRRVIAPTATTRVSPAERPPAAAGFEPLAFGAAGAKDQWVLGSVPCDKSRLCAAIVRTTDDGASFARVAAPKSGLEVANGQFKELGIFFADASHGWVFGPGLWSSDDGGATWVEEHLSGAVMDVQASDGEVYVLLCPQGLSGCLGNSSPGMELLRAPVGGGRWEALSLPVVLHYGSSLAVHAHTVAVMNGLSSGVATLAVSTDDGLRFVTEASSCEPGLSGHVYPALEGGAVLWESCPTGMLAKAAHSTDDGRTWSEVPTGPFSNGLGIAGLSATTALLWPSAPRLSLALTTDGGRQLRTVFGGTASQGGGSPTILSAGFVTPSRAYLLVSKVTASTTGLSTQLWESDNGGESFFEVRLSR